ncbi:hypothetical protein [uncultured Porphyromonas sp.]|jgi:hypothetical protein|uniref:hypothetical protein n=1 Tax=uncultured Porphyromonas sp. TaxID=159274 RepID=UPI0028059D22|nr:hypothetical protein [uncultured Porphyromonas sp.]
MTRDGLNTLKEIERKVSKLREEAERLRARIINFYRDEEDVLDQEAHIRLSYAGAAVQDAVPCITDALLGLQKAYDAEKALMDTYDGLLNNKSNE